MLLYFLTFDWICFIIMQICFLSFETLRNPKWNLILEVLLLGDSGVGMVYHEASIWTDYYSNYALNSVLEDSPLSSASYKAEMH